jgi:oxalate decarboxylase
VSESEKSPPVAAGAAGASDPSTFGNPRDPAELPVGPSHLFHLSTAVPIKNNDGGTILQAHEDNFPILRGEEASIALLTLKPGGIREPHWHPSAWEINYVTTGVATWTTVDVTGHTESFEQHAGDVVFAPQGYLHYFENKGTEDCTLVIVFNSSAVETKNDIGIGVSVSKMPPDVLGAIFGVPADTFTRFKKIDSSLGVLKKPET